MSLRPILSQKQESFLDLSKSTMESENITKMTTSLNVDTQHKQSFKTFEQSTIPFLTNESSNTPPVQQVRINFDAIFIQASSNLIKNLKIRINKYHNRFKQINSIPDFQITSLNMVAKKYILQENFTNKYKGTNLINQSIIKAILKNKSSEGQPANSKTENSKSGKLEESCKSIDNEYEDTKDAFQSIIEKRAINQIKQKLIQNEQKLVGNNLIIPMKFLRGTESLILRIFRVFNYRKDLRVLVLAQNNKRAEQIIQTVELSFKGQVQITKFLSSKKKNQQQEQQRDKILQNRLYITLTKRFQQHLLQKELLISDFSIVVIDEVNQLTDSHPLKEIMSIYYFNNQSQEMPIIVGCFPVESIFKSIKNEEQQEHHLFMIANILNAKMLMLDYKSVLKVQQKCFDQLENIAYNYFQPVQLINILNQHITFDFILTRYLVSYASNEQFQDYSNKLTSYIQEKSRKNTDILNFLQVPLYQNNDKSITFQMAKQPEPVPNLFELKQLQKELYINIGDQILHQNDCQKIFEQFIQDANTIQNNVFTKGFVFEIIESAKILGISLVDINPIIINQKQSNNQKLNIFTNQFVENKIRYFSSIFHIDNFLLPIFSKILTSQSDYHKIIICNRDISIIDCAIHQRKLSFQKIYVFKKKLEKEANLILEIVALLIQNKYMLGNLKINEFLVYETFKAIVLEFYQQINYKMRLQKIEDLQQLQDLQRDAESKQIQEVLSNSIEQKNYLIQQIESLISQGQISRIQSIDQLPEVIQEDDNSKDININASISKITLITENFQNENITELNTSQHSDQSDERREYLTNTAQLIEEAISECSSSNNNMKKLKVFVNKFLIPSLKARFEYLHGEMIDNKYNIKWARNEPSYQATYKLIFELQQASDNFKEVSISVNNSADLQEYVQKWLKNKVFFQREQERLNIKCKFERKYIYIEFSTQNQFLSNQVIGTQIQINKEIFKCIDCDDQLGGQRLLENLMQYAKKIMRDDNIEKNQEFIDLALSLQPSNEQIISKIVLPPVIQNFLQREKRDNEIGNVILYFCITVLSRFIPNSSQHDFIREELARLIFVGDSSTSQAVVIHLILSEDASNMEKQLDHKKISYIKAVNIKKKCEQMGLEKILLEENNSQVSSDKQRPLEEVFQSIMGFLSVYVGLDIVQLMVYDLKIINNFPGKLRHSKGNIEDVKQKVEIFQELSRLHKKQYNDNFEKEFLTYLYYFHIEQFTVLKPNKEQYTNCKAQNLTEIKPEYEQNIESGYMHQLLSGRLIYFGTCDCPDELNMDQVSKIINIHFENRFISFPENNQNQGYVYRSRRHILESMTHKSASDKMIGFINSKQLKLEAREILTILDEMEKDLKCNNEKLQIIQEMKQTLDNKVQKDQNIINEYAVQFRQAILQTLNAFDYQRNEYLGDSLLNFQAAKLFYFDTFQWNEPWQADYMAASKLHELKTFFTANSWLAFLICEHYVYGLRREYRVDVFEKIQTKKLEEVIKLIPLIPILNNEQNEQYHFQVKEFQAIVYQMIAEGCQYTEDIKANKKPLSLKQFKNNSQENQTEFDQDLISGKYVKILSDVIEALFGSFFTDSADLILTGNAISKLLSSRFVNNFPLKENPRTRVLNILNSKSYCQNLKITHSIEERGDDVYIKTFIGYLEVRRMKFKKDQKKKINKSYNDFQRFMEELYFQYELSSLYQSKSLAQDDFMEFARAFRKRYNQTTYTRDLGYLEKIAVQIFQQAKQNKEESDYSQISPQKLTTEQAKYFRDYLIKIVDSIKIDVSKILCADYGIKYNHQKSTILLWLEHERVRHLMPRNLLSKAGIGQIQYRVNQKFAEWVNELTNHQAYNLFIQLKKYGEVLQGQAVVEPPEPPIPTTEKESSDQASTIGYGVAASISDNSSSNAFTVNYFSDNYSKR